MLPTKREGWKEIAAHFGVGVRTAQIWEAERGLPVRRLPGPRGRVYAETEELEAWRDGLSGGLPKEEVRIWPMPWPAIGVISLLLVAATGVWYWKVQRNRQPSDFRLVGRHLTVLDQQGQSLFPKDFDGPVFRSWERSASWASPVSLDIDGDGDNEFLFPWRQGEDSQESDQLLCFSRTGRLLWSVAVGKEIHSGDRSFNSPFRIARFAPVNLGGGRRGLVVTAHHQLEYPMQVVLIGVDGRRLREYWHSGQLTALLVTDLNADGRDEIYLGGCANSTKRATLVVLDPFKMDGASHEQDPKYQLQGFSPPVEVARVQFHRSAASESQGTRNVATRLFRESDHLVVQVLEVSENDIAGNVFHRFDVRLHHDQIGAGDGMTIIHDRLAGQRRISVSLAADLERIAEPVWITSPHS